MSNAITRRGALPLVLAAACVAATLALPIVANAESVVVRGADGENRFARVKIPRALPRMVPVDGPEVNAG